MAYIGKNLVGVLKEQKSVSTMTGDGSDTTLTLSDTPGSVNNVLVFFDGIRQQPATDYSVDGTTLTFTTAPESGVIVTAIVGNHSGVNPKNNSITTSKLVDGSITGDNIPSITGSQLSGLAASKLTGTLPAIDGSALTGVVEHIQVTKSASDPALTTNPSDGLGTMWCNTTTGNMYVCTDATTNSNVWTNMGKGTGDIINVAPTNYTDSFPDLIESASTNYTFSGATDDGSVAHYLVEQISNSSLLAVTTAEKPAGQAHTFTTQAVGSDTNVTFVVKTKDNLGKYSSGVTITVAILNNVAPTNPTNTASFPDINKNTSQNFIFTGATDPDAGDTVTHYMVDQISNAALSVTAAEVAKDSAHAFSAGNVAADTAVTFRVRAKDDKGNYSSGITVSMDVLNVIYTIATSTNSTNTNGIINGNYKYHVFNQSGSFNVSQIGNTDATVEYLVVAGGGGGTQYGAGGAGGYRTAAGHTVSVQNYTITVGGGGGGVQGSGQASNGDDSVFSSITSIGGGGGAANTTGRTGGSGGGGGDYTNAGGAGTSGQGNAGGSGYTGSGGTGGGGGGGAQGAGGNGGPSASDQSGGTGGLSAITGTSTRYAGGGGGRLNTGGTTVYWGGDGGGGNGVHLSTGASANGTANTGGGAGSKTGGGAVGGTGGSGVVIIRYKFQN